MTAPEVTELRGEAEERLRTRQESPAAAVAEADSLALLHELQVHQIELEMQNEELQRVRTAAEEAGEKYQSLFDFSPVGCFVWDSDSRILEINLAGAALLGSYRSALMQQRFSQYVAMEDRAAFIGFCKQTLSSASKQTCEVRLLVDGRAAFALVEGISARERYGLRTVCRAAVIDITRQKRADELAAANQALQAEIAQRTRVEQSLHASEERHRLLAETMLQGVVHQDANGTIVAMNPAAERILGKSPAEFLGSTSVQEEHHTIHEDGSPFPGEKHPSMVALRTGKPVRGVVMGVLNPKKKAYRWIEIDAVPVVRAGETRAAEVYTVFEDITNRKRREEQLAKLTRLYATLSEANEAIARIRDVESLLAAVCRIVAERGGFPLVWIGLIKGKRLVPAASAGTALDYLHEIQVEVQGKLGKGPMGTCVRENRAVVNDDFARNPETAPWREAAKRYGFRASAGFPLCRGGKPIGALSLYAAEAKAFDAEQVRLLESLSADLSYALDSLDQEQIRLRTEQALHASQERLAMAIQAGKIGMFVWNVPSGEVFWSPQTDVMLGNEPSTASSSTAHCYQDWAERVHPDDLPNMEQLLQRSLGEHVPYEGLYRVVWPDGSVRWIQSRGQPEYDADGRCVRILGTVVDVTDRKLAEEARRESERQFRTLAESIPNLAWWANADGHLTWYNRRWYDYTGTTPEQMEGWGWQRVHDPEMLPQVLKRWKASIASGEPFEMTFPLRGADGVFRPFLTRSIPLKDDAGCVLRWFGTNTDVSQQKLAEEALCEARDELERRVEERTAELAETVEELHSAMQERIHAEQLLQREHRALVRLIEAGDRQRRDISLGIHDNLAQPLTSATMHLQAAEGLKNENPEAAAEAQTTGLAMLRESINEARRLISGVRPPILEDEGVEAAIMHLACERRGPDAPRVEFHIDAKFDRLDLALENAIYRIAQIGLDNACQHSKSHCARIELLQHGQRLSIEIRDWGVGFDPQAIEEASFGLEEIRQRTSLLGGTVSIESAPGRGTRIAVDLPLLPRDANAANGLETPS